MHQTLKERAELLMNDLKLNQVGLASFAGITKGAVNQWLNSKPDATMSPIPAYKIADKTRYAPRWLMLGDGPMKTIARELSSDELKTVLAFPMMSHDERDIVLLIVNKASERAIAEDKAKAA